MIAKKEVECSILHEFVTLEITYIPVATLGNAITRNKVVSFNCMDRLSIECDHLCPFNDDRLLESL